MKIEQYSIHLSTSTNTIGMSRTYIVPSLLRPLRRMDTYDLEGHHEDSWGICAGRRLLQQAMANVFLKFRIVNVCMVSSSLRVNLTLCWTSKSMPCLGTMPRIYVVKVHPTPCLGRCHESSLFQAAARVWYHCSAGEWHGRRIPACL